MLKLNYDIFIMMTNFGLKHSSHYKAVGYHEYADLINRINKGVQLYSNSMQELSQKGTDGLSEAFVAFRNYFAEKDVFEVCMTLIFLIPYFHYYHCLF